MMCTLDTEHKSSPATNRAEGPGSDLRRTTAPEGAWFCGGLKPKFYQTT
jgi:hypothetical protein